MGEKQGKPVASANEKTIELAYEECVGVQEALYEREKSLDGKVLAVFGIGSLATSIGPTLSGSTSSPGAAAAWIGMVLAWMLAAAFAVAAFRARGWRMGPEPKVLLHPTWTRKSPKAYMYFRIHYFGELFDDNLEQCNRKAAFLNLALLCVAVEVVLLAVALILPRVT